MHGWNHGLEWVGYPGHYLGTLDGSSFLSCYSPFFLLWLYSYGVSLLLDDFSLECHSPFDSTRQRLLFRCPPSEDEPPGRRELLPLPLQHVDFTLEGVGPYIFVLLWTEVSEDTPSPLGSAVQLHFVGCRRGGFLILCASLCLGGGRNSGGITVLSLYWEAVVLCVL